MTKLEPRLACLIEESQKLNCKRLAESSGSSNDSILKLSDWVRPLTKQENPWGTGLKKSQEKTKKKTIT
jgi:hypothetical protein